MGIHIATPGVHHVPLRVADSDRARRCCADALGFPVPALGERCVALTAPDRIAWEPHMA